MPYPALSISLYDLENGGYCTNPVQPIIASPVATTATEGVLKVIDPITPAIFLANTTATVTALSSLVNCSASITGSGATISVTPTTASLPTSLTFELTDGNANTDTETLSLTVSAGAGMASVTILDDLLTDFTAFSVVVDDVIAYDTVTTLGNTVEVDTYGHIATYPAARVPGESFDFTINGGATQTYTWS